MISYFFQLCFDDSNLASDATNWRYLILILLVHTFGTDLVAQPAPSVDPTNWKVEWEMQAREYKKMKRTTTSEFYFSPEHIKINDRLLVMAPGIYSQVRNSLQEIS